MTSSHSLEEAQNQAALYALGCLSVDEARAFEAHLGSGCTTCAAEVAAFASVAADLAHAAPPARPRSSVRGRVLAATAPTEPRPFGPAVPIPGILFVRAGQVPWKEVLPGVELKPLSVDAQGVYATQLVRMRPGSTYPAHRHAGVEETYLLEGDLLVHGVEMHAGDYCRAEPDSIHELISTRNGCVFLATASVEDELLA